MILVDTHTHLYVKEFDEDRDAVIENAIKKGIKYFFLPSIDRNSTAALIQLAKAYPHHCLPMMGLHPCSVSQSYETELTKMEEWLKKERFYAIGETGLDFYHDITFAKEQEIAFRKQLEWATEWKLPVVIHSRNAFQEIYTILKDLPKQLRGIFHCFTGTLEEANKIIDIGFKLGIGGVITYKNSGLAEVIKHIELENIVLETDSPYLSPVPYRGKRNDSSNVLIIAQKLAEIKKCEVERIAEITTQNAMEVFKIGK